MFLCLSREGGNIFVNPYSKYFCCMVDPSSSNVPTKATSAVNASFLNISQKLQSCCFDLFILLPLQYKPEPFQTNKFSNFTLYVQTFFLYNSWLLCPLLCYSYSCSVTHGLYSFSLYPLQDSQRCTIIYSFKHS